MEIGTIVYRNVLQSRGICSGMWNFVRIIMIKLFHDPSCRLSIHGRYLNIPLSHALPIYLKNHRFYDRLPHRLSEYIHGRDGRMKCIDVGANIGDSIAAMYQDVADQFIAIEPNPTFYPYLESNWSWNKRVRMLNVVCSSGSHERRYVIQEKSGTASLARSDVGVAMNAKSIDQIVLEIPEFADSNLVKVDTDGHDFEVIEGAAQLISRNSPAVLFECGPFSNVRYVEDCLTTMRFFKEVGYGSFLLYDNFGCLMGRYSFSDLTIFRSLLFYNLTSDFNYFDILVMKDEQVVPFYGLELDYFVKEMRNRSMQETARFAAQ